MIHGAYKKEQQMKPKRYYDLENNGSTTTLIVVDENGETIVGGNLLEIDNETASVSMLPNVSPELGFHFDPDTRTLMVQRPGKGWA